MHAMRTGACTADAAADLASASGEALGSTLPIACIRGRPSITPAPRRNVRRGINHFFFWNIASLVWDKTGAETESWSRFVPRAPTTGNHFSARFPWRDLPRIDRTDSIPARTHNPSSFGPDVL